MNLITHKFKLNWRVHGFALKPSLAGEGGVRRYSISFFSTFFILYNFKNKENKEKRICFNVSSPQPSSKRGLKAIFSIG